MQEEIKDLRYYWDLQGAIDTHVDKGIEIGMKEGMEIGKKNIQITIAKNLLQIGLPIKQIAEGTGLTEEEIKQLNS